MTKYTVFYSSGFLTDGNCGCHALVDFLREEVVGSMPPIAWAPVAYWEWAKENRGRDCDYLRAESIAAGRLIEFRDGKYIPLGVAEEAPKTEEKFCDRLARDAAADLSDDELEGLWDYGFEPERVRPPLTWAAPAPFDPWKGFFTEPADIADWQDTYFPR